MEGRGQAPPRILGLEPPLPRGVCSGGLGRTPPKTIGDSRTEFNRILCTSKSEAAETSNKKLRCRYVEADCRQTRNIARPLCDS